MRCDEPRDRDGRGCRRAGGSGGIDDTFGCVRLRDDPPLDGQSGATVDADISGAICADEADPSLATPTGPDRSRPVP